MGLLYEKRRIAIDDTHWTPVSSPIVAQKLAVRNAGNVTVITRTRVDDPNTEDIISPGVQEVIELYGHCVVNYPLFFAQCGAPGSSSTLVVTASAG